MLKAEGKRGGISGMLRSATGWGLLCLLLSMPAAQACLPPAWVPINSYLYLWSDRSGWQVQQRQSSLDIYNASAQLQYRLLWKEVMPVAYQAQLNQNLDGGLRCIAYKPWIYHGRQSPPGPIRFAGQHLIVRVLLNPSYASMASPQKTCGPYKELLFDRDTGNPLNTWETAEVINPCPQSAL